MSKLLGGLPPPPPVAIIIEIKNSNIGNLGTAANISL
jgi:hypothetical protein